MDEELKKRLLAYMDTLDSAVREGGDFVLEQAPLVVQEYVTYSRVSLTVPVVFGVALAFLAFPVAARCRRMRGDKGYGPEFDKMMLTAFVHAICTTAGIIIVACNFNLCIMSWFAPRLLILEKIADLIK